MSYRLCLLSFIPVVKVDGGYATMDLWARDLEAQMRAIEQVVLLCPVRQSGLEPAEKLIGLDPRIEVVDIETTPRDALRKHVAQADVLQVPGNATWSGSARARALMRAARALRKPAVVGISSNRAKSALMNASRSARLERLHARLQYLSVRAGQIDLALRAAGVFIVGEGLRSLVERWNANIHVGTASWVRDVDILGPRRGRLCAAARLERMKGVHLAIEAMPLVRVCPGTTMELLVAGVGPEEAVLRRISHDSRVLFDAISQGCIPICPDSRPYRSLNLPTSILYRRGDAHSLAAVLLALVRRPDLVDLRCTLEAIARASTIESMHGLRRQWIESRVLVR